MSLRNQLENVGWGWVFNHDMNGTSPETCPSKRVQDTLQTTLDGIYRKSPRSLGPDGVSLPLPFEPELDHALLSLVHADISTLMLCGYPDVRYLSGAVIPKILYEPMRPWHVDWWNWDDPVTKAAEPPVIGIMHYFDDASVQDSGAPMVIEGSHRKSISEHEKYIGTDFVHPYEKTIYVRRFEIIAIDARLAHATNLNEKSNLRTCITTWYIPNWGALSEESQATAMLSMNPTLQETFGSFAPDYAGNAKPVPHVKVPKFL